jgi:hypothetical protein
MISDVFTLIMSRTASRSTMNMSNSDFDATVAKFAPSAWKHYTTNGDIKVWAREFARQFVHAYPGSTFLPVYYRLISYADAQMSQAEAVQKEQGTFPSKRVVNPSSAPSSVDRATLNRVLYREVNRWWSAFMLEGQDENPNAMDKFDHNTIGVERFVWHCAKVLANSHGSTAESMMPVVQGWLHSARTDNYDYFTSC